MVGIDLRTAGATRPKRPGAYTLARAVAVLILLAGLGACGGDAGEDAVARHVVVISMDTARADHFGFMGAVEGVTPRLDELADESIVFTDCMTAVPTTLASHTTLFTGKYPHHHGAPRNGFVVSEENEMLPEILKREGFTTAGFAASFALESRFNFAQGFDYYSEDFNIKAGEGEVDQNQRVAADVTDAVTQYLDNAGVPDRLFLFVHYFDPHRPYAAPAPYDKMFDPLGREDLETVMAVRRDKDMTLEERESQARRLELQYTSEIAYMDNHIGRLLDGLRERGLLDESLLLVTSDHGENMWDHKTVFDHGSTVYQSTAQAVCVFRLPGASRGGSRVSQLVGNIDILPTLLEYLDMEIPRNIDGEAVDLDASTPSSEERVRFCQASKPHGAVEKNTSWLNMHKSRCIRKGNHKYVQNPYAGTEELYDLNADRGERRNLLRNPSREVVSLMAGLRGELEAWAASADPLPSQFEHLKRKETIERLRSLGYIE
jgi:arylsulfatase A-like enzyme